MSLNQASRPLFAPIFFAVFAALALFAGSVRAQEGEHWDLCVRRHLAARAQAGLGIAPSDAERYIRNIAARTSVQVAQVTIVPCQFVDRAETRFAAPGEESNVPAGEYLLYNEQWTREVMGADRVQAIALFAHELAHLLNRDFHPPRNTISRVQRETEADEFAGCAVRMMQGDWPTLENLLSRIRSEQEGGGYPARAQSLEAARRGFDRCSSSTSDGAPDLAGRIDLNFDAVRTNSQPDYIVAAAPFLHNAAIPIDIVRVTPDQSRVVLRNNIGLYGGGAVSPSVSQNFLTQVNVDHNAPSSFRLRLGRPVRSITFQIPAIFPASESGVTFPAWRATAFSTSGRQLSTVSEGLARRLANAPAQTYTLRAPDFEGIGEIEFESDWRLNGRPFAGFEAILIEQMIIEP